MSAYFDVFIESAITASIIPFGSNPSFFAMLSFGNYNMFLAAILAISGAALGIIFNFILGRFLLSLYQKTNGTIFLPIEKYNKFLGIFSRYFIVLLPFSWLPMFNFFVFFAGFFQTRAKLALPLAIAGQIGYYCWYLLK